MGRVYGGAANTTPATDKNIKKDNKKASTNSSNFSYMPLLIGIVLGMAMSVGGYFAFTMYYGYNPTPSTIVASFTGGNETLEYTEVLAKHGIDLERDFTQSSFVNPAAVMKIDTKTFTTKGIKLSSSTMESISDYKSNKSEANGMTVYALDGPGDSITVSFKNNQIKSVDYHIINSMDPKPVDAVICGISVNATLDEVLTQTGVPGYVSSSDTYGGAGGTSVSLTYIDGDDNLTISFSDMNGSMRIISISYSNMQ